MHVCLSGDSFLNKVIPVTLFRSVNKSSGAFIMLLGARSDMDHETSTRQLFHPIMNHFASPLSERREMITMAVSITIPISNFSN